MGWGGCANCRLTNAMSLHLTVSCLGEVGMPGGVETMGAVGCAWVSSDLLVPEG